MLCCRPGTRRSFICFSFKQRLTGRSSEARATRDTLGSWGVCTACLLLFPSFFFLFFFCPLLLSFFLSLFLSLVISLPLLSFPSSSFFHSLFLSPPLLSFFPSSCLLCWSVRQLGISERGPWRGFFLSCSLECKKERGDLR